MNTITQRKSLSDIIGALASGLCVIHCMATPFLFIAQSSHPIACSSIGLGWWSAIDFIFIGITALAVYQSGKNSSRELVKYSLYATWLVLTLFILNEKLHFLPIPSVAKYGAALTLILLHIYNLKYCRCADESCCVAV